MAMDEEKVQETEVGCGVSDGGGSDCCSEIGGGGRGWKSWKTAIFVLVLLAAGAVAAHSVLTNGNRAAACGSVCTPDMVSANNPACTVEKKVCTKEASVSESKTCEKAKQYVKETQCPQSKPTSNCPVTNKDKPASSCCPKAGASAGSK